MVSTGHGRLSAGRRATIAMAAFSVLLTTGLMAPLRASAAGAIACGSVITASTTLQADVGPCPADGLTIAASNITLDLGGHKVIGTFTQQGAMPPTNVVEAIGIHLAEASGVTVTHGTIFHFAVGVRLDGGSGNSVTHLNVHDNIGILPSDAADNGDGIALRASDHNLIDS